jgi:predicted nucleotidyltransferase
VYGSVARQEDTTHSDVDLMLVGDGLTLAEVLPQLLPLEAQLGQKINPNCYTPQEFARRLQEPDSFVNRVLSQPVLPLIGDPHGLG